MITTLINLFVNLLAVYLLAGILFSVFFYLKGATRIDEGIKEAPWHFKLIIFPGVVMFWGVLLFKLMRRS